MNMSEKIDLLMPALVLARSEMSFVAKGGDNTFDKYRYAKLENYVRASEAALIKNGIFVAATVDSVQQLDNRTTKNGGNEYVVRLHMTMRAFHTSGQWVEVQSIGDGQDRGDKAIYKANTGATKYAYGRLFGLVTSDDPEDCEPTTQPPQRETPADPARPQASEAKQAFSKALTSWTGLQANDLAAAAREVSAFNNLSLDEKNYHALKVFVDDAMANEVKYFDWSNQNKKQSAKVKG